MWIVWVILGFTLGWSSRPVREREVIKTYVVPERRRVDDWPDLIRARERRLKRFKEMRN